MRQTIAAMLTQGEYSALELASALLLTQREVEEHLAHLRRTHKQDLRTRPALCRQCGYEFSQRSRLDSPGRCPRCRQELVEGPWFSLKSAKNG